MMHAPKLKANKTTYDIHILVCRHDLLLSFLFSCPKQPEPGLRLLNTAAYIQKHMPSL